MEEWKGNTAGLGAANAKDALLNISHPYDLLRKQASLFTNGVPGSTTSTGLSGGWDLLTMTIPASTVVY